ncbi:MAG: nuclear transport factor 2 family protein [Flavobacteriaceae bacterium]
MKRLILVVSVMTLIVACKQGPDRWTEKSAEIDVVKALVKDYEAGSWDAWTGHYADTAKMYHNSTEPSTVSETLEGLKGYLETTSEYGFSDEDIYYEMIIDNQGERWVNFWGTWEGNIGALNRDLQIPVHLTLQFVDGKIVEEHGYYNMVEYVMVMNEIAAMADAENSEEE